MLINFVKNTSLLLIFVSTLLRTQNGSNNCLTVNKLRKNSVLLNIQVIMHMFLCLHAFIKHCRNHNDRYNKPCKIRTQDWKVLTTKNRFLRMFPHWINFWTFLRDMTAFPLFAINNSQQIKASFLGKHYSFFHGPRIVFTSQTRLWASY